eukprot:6176558-Pleurochrysis_carterae.AAC.2
MADSRVRAAPRVRDGCALAPTARARTPTELCAAQDSTRMSTQLRSARGAEGAATREPDRGEAAATEAGTRSETQLTARRCLSCIKM